jgi:hypothetical protein
MIVESVDRNQLIFNKLKINIKSIKVENPVCRRVSQITTMSRLPCQGSKTYNDACIYVIIGNGLFTINNLFLLIHEFLSKTSSLDMEINSLTEINHV